MWPVNSGVQEWIRSFRYKDMDRIPGRKDWVLIAIQRICYTFKRVPWNYTHFFCIRDRTHNLALSRQMLRPLNQIPGLLHSFFKNTFMYLLAHLSMKKFMILKEIFWNGIEHTHSCIHSSIRFSLGIYSSCTEFWLFREGDWVHQYTANTDLNYLIYR